MGASEGFESKKCRPKKSPFKNKEGLEKVQTCLRTNVKAVYEEQLGQVDTYDPYDSSIDDIYSTSASNSILSDDVISTEQETLQEKEGKHALFIEKEENVNNVNFDGNISRNNNLAYELDLYEDIATGSTSV